MSLANMITASSVRKQELLERPALQLREQKAFRSSEALKEETIKTSAQNRLLAGKEEERDVKAEARTSELHPGNVEKQKYQVGTAAYNEQSAKLKVFTERQAASEGAPQETVNQAIATWKIWQETGNPEARKQTYNIMNGLAGSPEMQGLLAYNIPYGDMSTITSEMLNDPNDPSGEQTDKMLGLVFMNAEMNMKAYQASQKEKAQRTAAELLAMTSAQAEGEATGEILGTARGIETIREEGLTLPEEPLSEGQQSRVQQTMGDFLSAGPLKEAGKDAGKAWVKKNLDKNGEFAKAVGKMPAEMYTREMPILEAFFERILSDGYSEMSNADFREELSTLANSDTLAKESPIRLKLLDLWNKKVKIGNMRDIKSFTQTPTPKI
jgi:hypothetical protein